MPEPLPASERPPSGPPRPPAPPTTGEPSGGPDPADLGPPIMVRLGDLILGDLGNPAVDAALVAAIVIRSTEQGRGVGRWLHDQGVTIEALDTAWPRRHDPPEAAPWRRPTPS